MADNESGIDFEVTLGGDIDEKAEADAQKEKNGNGDNANSDEPISESKNGGRVGVREFYEKIVEPVVGSITGQGQEFAIQFAEKLKNGKVPAVDIYNVAGMKVYSLSTEDDRKRISSWCDEWTKEAQKLGNKEQEKRENLSFAIPEFRNLFMHQSLCEELRDSLLDIAWSKLDALINATCSDKIVELEEVCSIQDAAVELGLLDLSSGESRRDFKERLAEKTKELGAEIDTIEEAFKRFYNEKKEKDPTITIDTNFSKTELVVEFQRLKKFHVKLFPEDSDKFNDLEEFMNACGIVLKDKIQYFEEDYFDDFKKHVKLSQLQQSIYKGTKKLAMCKEYGFSETDWEKFVEGHGHDNPLPWSVQEHGEHRKAHNDNKRAGNGGGHKEQVFRVQGCACDSARQREAVENHGGRENIGRGFHGKQVAVVHIVYGLSGKFSDIRQTVQRERREKRTQMDEIL